MNQNNNKSSIKSFVIVAAFLAIFGSLLYSSRNVESLDTEKVAKHNYKKTVATAEETKSDDSQESPFKPLLAQKPDVQSPAVLQSATGSSNDDDDGTLISGTGSEGGTSGTNLSGTNSLASGSGQQSSPSVPQTGNTNITVALVLSSIALAFGFVVLAKNPRQLALNRFEKRITKKL